MFSSRDDTAIIFEHFLYGIFWKAHLVRSLTVRMSLPTRPSCSSEPTISTWTGINALSNASNSLSPTIVSKLIFCAINVEMVVFRPFYTSVTPCPCILIIESNLILNYVATRKTWPFTNIKSTPRCSVL